MSLKAKIKGAVNKAFVAAGDLVQKATFYDITTSGYDFATGQASQTSKSTTVDIILLETTKQRGEAFEIKAIIKAGPNMDYYDSLTINSVKYYIVSFTDNGYAVELTLKREA